MSQPARKVSSESPDDLRSFTMNQIDEDNRRYELASTNSRVVAFIIDIIIVTAVSGMIKAGLRSLLHVSGSHPFIGFFASWISPIYFVLMQYNDGQTLGKKIMGIKVVSDRTTEFLGLGQAFGRETIGRFLSALPLCLGYLGASRRPDKKTFHDRIFDTRVVKTR